MAITLAGQSLPDPQRYTTTVGYRGKGSTMLDGTTKFDLVDSTAKQTFIIGYISLTTAQRTTLETAWASLKTATATLVDFDAESYTVTRSPAAPDLSFNGMITATGMRWAVTINLIED